MGDQDTILAFAMLILTAALVGATFWYASLTHRLAEATKATAVSAAEAASAAVRSAKASELGLRLQSLPLVVPQVVVHAQLGEEVVLTNVGNTVATNVEVFMDAIGTSPPWSRTVLEALAAGAQHSILFRRDEIAIGAHVTVALVAQYDDPMGNRYRFQTAFQRTSPAKLLTLVGGEWRPFLPEA